MTATIPFFDGHNDFLLRLMMTPAPREETWLGTGAMGHLDLARMKASGFAGGLFAIFVPPASGGPPPDFKALMANPPYDLPMPPEMTHAQAQPVALTMAGLLHWMERAAPQDFRVCRSVAEIRASMAAGRIAGVMHMEGAEAIGPDLDALYLFHQMGLRSLGPVWSRPTIFGYGVPMAFPGTPDIGPGLTEKGRDLVRLCDELRILIDLSHLNEKGFDDVAALSTAPLVATHSNAHALCESPRNLTDRQLHTIRERGGMVGFNYAAFYLNADGTADQGTGWDVMLRHLDHLISEAGEDNVGLGSDFDGCVPPYLIGDVTGVPRLFERMQAHGYDAPLIEKLARGNWLRCLERCIG
ncbi:dipeptidase [Roseibacterium sp. SDUM158016]|uniref:dipeptidase n=1 Tax=Roseicyclus sediminis TaxID=2980997 RepID=UPI0021D3318D|nr:dipeptidase [Roseibacterium sp. SDUM158016]MCU4653080.1 dipeptidase [Roseibacterium sp. SDUM158016]